MTVETLVQALHPFAMGFAIAVVAGHFATKSIVDAMWEYINTLNPNVKKLVRYPGQQQIVGIVERSLYYSSLLFNQPVFIGVWLTLKTVSKSSRWNDTDAVPGRAIFQPFLAGTGLSLLFAGGGYLVTYCLERSNSNSKEMVVVIIAGLLVVWALCYYFSKSALRELEAKTINVDFAS